MGLSGIERFSTLALPGIALSRSGQDYDYLALDPSRVFVRAIPDTPERMGCRAHRQILGTNYINFISTTAFVDAKEYYLREDVRNAIVEHAQAREVGVRYGDSFGSRPDMISYPNDVTEFSRKGATSFHISEERWHNPLDLKVGMRKQDMDALRSGWDFIIDVDCPIWEYSKIITHLLTQALIAHGIDSVTVKFSGNKGFHIGVPFEAFPAEFQSKPMSAWFPEAPRKMAEYLVYYINSEEMGYALSKKILGTGSLQKISDITGKTKDELMALICPNC